MKEKVAGVCRLVAVKASTAVARVRDDEEGQGLVEYGLIIGLVAIALVVTLGLLTGSLQAVFANITATLKAA